MKEKYIYFEEDAENLMNILNEKKIAIIGYGNQGRSQALNLRDSGCEVIIGNIEDKYKQRAIRDNFEVYEISEAIRQADIIFLLIPDEDMPQVYEKVIKDNLKPNCVLNFASGYNIAFDLIKLPKNIDVIMIAPRMIGVGVRQRYLNGEGYYSLVSVHQDSSDKAKDIMLALCKALGTLKAGAIEVTMKQEAILDLFNEQAFGPAFGRVLLTAIDVLMKNGIPPEAILCEMYLSEEMSYIYRKFKEIGIVKQMSLHSHTSQYGSLSRGVRYLGMGKKLKEKFQKTYEEIASGKFAKEWQGKLAKIRFKLMKYFALKQKINKIEEEVRRNLRMKNIDLENFDDIEEILENKEFQDQIKEIEDWFDY
ncbi:MAG: ketol-acid reductoisomerase [Promethearchaeota archaeon]